MRLLACIACLLIAAPALAAVPPLPLPDLVEPAMTDDGDRETLLAAVARSRAWMRAGRARSLTVAGRTVAAETLDAGLERFEALVRDMHGTEGFEAAVRDAFEWVPMPGHDGAGAVHVTGYHLPMLEAREAPDAVFKHPLYAPPPDMVPIDLGAFRPSLAGQTAQARIVGGRILPYHTRTAIDDGRALAGKGLEIAWVADPAQRTSMMMQGSGLLRFPDGRVVNANYAAQNGHVFAAGPTNQSYVFFKLAPDGPYGCDGIPLTGGRSIATDKRLFASGALAWIAYPRARLGARGVEAWEPGGRFVLDQDTGGAIKGPGRVDLYWGGGDEARQRAFSLNGAARVWYLLPR